MRPCSTPELKALRKRFSPEHDIIHGGQMNLLWFPFGIQWRDMVDNEQGHDSRYCQALCQKDSSKEFSGKIKCILPQRQNQQKIALYQLA